MAFPGHLLVRDLKTQAHPKLILEAMETREYPLFGSREPGPTVSRRSSWLGEQPPGRLPGLPYAPFQTLVEDGAGMGLLLPVCEKKSFVLYGENAKGTTTDHRILMTVLREGSGRPHVSIKLCLSQLHSLP